MNTFVMFEYGPEILLWLAAEFAFLGLFLAVLAVVAYRKR